MLRILAVLVLLSACNGSDNSFIADIPFTEGDTSGQSNKHSINVKLQLDYKTDSIFELLHLGSVLDVDGEHSATRVADE